jgi:hypothetical protein
MTFQGVQPALPDWYFGSPLVAAQCQMGGGVSMHVSDADGNAVLAAAAALSSEAFWQQVIPSVKPPIVEAVELAVREYDPNSIRPIAPPGANILLLDPTYPDGYDQILRRSVAVCQDSRAFFLLVAWGMANWPLYATLTDLAVQFERASFSDETRTYEVFLCPFGESHDLSELAIAAVAGWE